MSNEKNNNTPTPSKESADNSPKNEEISFEDKINTEKKSNNTANQGSNETKKSDNSLDHSPEKPLRHMFFDAIAIWNLKDEFKNDIAKNIVTQVHTNIEYRSQMILAAVIATLGLLINSTAVVIGAMLIAPILTPIQAVSFSVSTGNKKLFLQGMRLLLLSIFFSVITGIVITWLIPLGEMTHEILIRTQPTLIDLCIAFASGIIAFLSFGYKKISTSIAGVAMAASLLPPLVVVGMGIGMQNIPIAWGSSVLLMTNLIAIIFAGIIIFYLFGFSPNQKKEFKTTLLTTFFSVIIVIILAIPLASSLFGIIDSIKERNIINTTTQTFLNEIDDRISLESFEKQGDLISLKLRAPADIDLTTFNKTNLTQQLADMLERNITLDMSITPYITTLSEESPQKSDQTIHNTLMSFFNASYPESIIIDTKILTHQTKNILFLTIFNPEELNLTILQNDLIEHFEINSITIDQIIIDQKTGNY